MRGPIETLGLDLRPEGHLRVTSRAKCAALLKPVVSSIIAYCTSDVTSRAKCAALLKRPIRLCWESPDELVTSRAKCAALLKPTAAPAVGPQAKRRHQPRQVRGPIETCLDRSDSSRSLQHVTSRAKCAALLKLSVDFQIDLDRLRVTSRAKCAALLKPTFCKFELSLPP